MVCDILASYSNFQMDQVQLGNRQQVNNRLCGILVFQVTSCYEFKEQTDTLLIIITLNWLFSMLSLMCEPQ